MSSVVCTLFEDHYHLGLAALVNSLYKNDFKGDIYAGYRGRLPVWAINLKENLDNKEFKIKTLIIKDNIRLHFVQLETKFHFTTYKPYFMLDVIEDIAKEPDGILYFDPDIVIKCNWSFYEKWITYGVGLVHEIINNDMPPNNPVRFMWNDRVELSGRKVTRSLYSYINAGFCGVSKQHVEFIKVWKDIIDISIKSFDFDPATFMINDPGYIFRGDQDALNIAAMCSISPISEMGPHAMDFIPGGYIMSHATGLKPWKKNYFLSALKGNSPTLADWGFWNNAGFPLMGYSNQYIKLKRFYISLAALIGRFYKKG